MKKLATLTALILALGAAAPAMGGERPLILVVSDFDAALARDRTAASEVVPPAEASASDELARILALLRQPRPGHDAAQPPTTARPL